MKIRMTEEEDHISNEEEVWKKDHLDEISRYFINEVIPYEKRPAEARQMMGDWYPIHYDETRFVLGFLHRSFENIAERFKKENGRKPVFLDLGSVTTIFA